MALLFSVLVIAPFVLVSPVAAQSSCFTQLAGYYNITLEAGPNFVSAPLPRLHSFRGLVSATSSNTLTVVGDPGWTTDVFAPSDGFAQFLVVVLQDASESPGCQGDWWSILENSADTLTVDAGTDDLSVLLAAGDQVEVRHLTSLRDLFGHTADNTLLLNQDSGLTPHRDQEDVIHFVEQTSFTKTIYFHDGQLTGSPGYMIDTFEGLQGPLDGSTITLRPDEPFVIFRKTGSTATNCMVLGQVPSTRFTHYLQPGPNPVGSPFPADTTLGGSNLKESGWVSDSNGIPSRLQEDVIRVVVGTGFANEIFHHDGTLGPAGWYIDGVMNDNYPFEPGRGYLFFISGTETFRWRQTSPTVP